MNAFDDAFYQLLPTKTNRELAEMYQCTRHQVQYQRIKLGVRNPKARGPKVDVSTLDDRFWRLLQEGAYLPGLAQQYNMTYSQVYYLRTKVTQTDRITPKREYPTAFYVELFKLKAKVLAVKYGTTVTKVEYQRRKHKQLGSAQVQRKLTPEDIRRKLGVHADSLGKMRDKELAQITGIREGTLSKYRGILGIPWYRGPRRAAANPVQLELPLG